MSWWPKEACLQVQRFSHINMTGSMVAGRQTLKQYLRTTSWSVDKDRGVSIVFWNLKANPHDTLSSSGPYLLILLILSNNATLWWLCVEIYELWEPPQPGSQTRQNKKLQNGLISSRQKWMYCLEQQNLKLVLENINTCQISTRIADETVVWGICMRQSTMLW